MSLAPLESRADRWLRSHPDLAALLILGVGLLLRLKTSSGTFLNYDEALHFSVANQLSWRLTYIASPTVSHPPFLIFFLHGWRETACRVFGSSELMLRLPSVIFGTGFCGFAYAWIKNRLGSQTALLSLIFLTFSPALIALSAEIRQYAPLLFFMAASLYFFDRAWPPGAAGRQGSPAVAMLLSMLSLNLTIFSHYSGILFAVAFGIYALLGLYAGRAPVSVIALWIAGQLAALALCAFLYLAYIQKLGTSALHGWMGDTYLHNSYFDPGRHHAIGFIFTRSVSVFQYVFAQSVVGTIGFILFLIGLVYLGHAKSSEASASGQNVVSSQANTNSSSYRLLGLLVLPFAIDCAAALIDKYPYGGTRHCAFLALFSIAGVGFALARLVQQRIALGIVIALGLIGICLAFPTRRLPYIARADQSQTHLRQLLAFIDQNVLASDLIFADNQTGTLLAHYLCHQQPVQFDDSRSVSGFESFTCGNHRILQTDMSAFVFTADNFLPRWQKLVATSPLHPGNAVWVLEAGWLWGDSLAQQLERDPLHGNLQPQAQQSFGQNITVFKLLVEENQKLKN